MSMGAVERRQIGPGGLDVARPERRSRGQPVGGWCITRWAEASTFQCLVSGLFEAASSKGGIASYTVDGAHCIGVLHARHEGVDFFKPGLDGLTLPTLDRQDGPDQGRTIVAIKVHGKCRAGLTEGPRPFARPVSGCGAVRDR